MGLEFDKAKAANFFRRRYCLAYGRDINWVLSKLPLRAYRIERKDERQEDRRGEASAILAGQLAASAVTSASSARNWPYQTSWSTLMRRTPS